VTLVKKGLCCSVAQACLRSCPGTLAVAYSIFVHQLKMHIHTCTSLHTTHILNQTRIQKARICLKIYTTRNLAQTSSSCSRKLLSTETYTNTQLTHTQHAAWLKPGAHAAGNYYQQKHVQTHNSHIRNMQLGSNQELMQQQAALEQARSSLQRQVDRLQGAKGTHQQNRGRALKELKVGFKGVGVLTLAE